MNPVLDRSQFKDQLIKMIPKAENTFEYKYDQQYGQSDAVRVIKAIQSTIRSEQSKRYDQQYN